MCLQYREEERNTINYPSNKIVKSMASFIKKERNYGVRLLQKTKDALKEEEGHC